MNNNQNKNSAWAVIIKVIIVVASAVAGAFGITSCIG